MSSHRSCIPLLRGGHRTASSFSHDGVAGYPAALLLLTAILFGVCSPNIARAEESAAEPAHGDLVPMPTLGGKQFWADMLFFHQWRIQRNALTGHFRLLDGRNFRHASGSLESCREVLDEIRRQQQLPPMRGAAVLVLHGLFRTHSSMEPLCQYLAENGGYLVCNVEYPSTRAGIAEHAAGLASIVENLDGIEEIHFVGHSLGNLVVRCYLSTALRGQQRGLPDPRIRRFVMLAPPNQGSEIAAALAENELFHAVAGQPGRQLGVEWPWLAAKLRVPACPFGIIAGGLGNEIGFNPLLPGDDDGTVTVASARLDGACDFLLLPVLHSSIMHNERVMNQTLNFLRNGQFAREDEAK